MQQNRRMQQRGDDISNITAAQTIKGIPLGKFTIQQAIGEMHARRQIDKKHVSIGNNEIAEKNIRLNHYKNQKKINIFKAFLTSQNIIERPFAKSTT